LSIDCHSKENKNKKIEFRAPIHALSIKNKNKIEFRAYILALSFKIKMKNRI